MPFYYFYPEVEITHKEKNIGGHPWEKYIKDPYIGTYKYGHNSAKNPIYPPPKKGKVPSPDRLKFTIIGTSVTKEFIYCVNLLQGLHKYRWSNFDAPVIKAVTSVEWPLIWNDLKIRYGGEAYCLQDQVAVILNDKFLGGKRELKELIEFKYIYYFRPDYYVEGARRFTNYINASGRPCACLEFMIDNKEIGPMIFMLYSDIVPRTCENFLRLCKEKRGGYSGTPVHRIVKDSWIQCGGFGLKNTDLDCENFIVPHDRRGVIGMTNDGRHVDCSTQFFVLLQPQDWMAFKYVAFGQLISGENVLQEIEQVPTWYESPKQNIIISKASILNLECHDIRINKEIIKYLEGHHENLLTIGEIFYEELLEKVFLEQQFRSLQRIQAEMIQLGAEATEFTPEEKASNLRTTQRFMRKKEEIDRQIQEKSQDHSGKTTPAVTVVKSENNDYDVEEYEYMPEEYSYKQVTVVASSSEIVKPEKPYLIPLTDVPYPGEVSSEFDLKRLLQGHYCLESDIDNELGKKKKKVDELKNYPERLHELFKPSPSEVMSETSLNSNDEREIATYLKDNADRVSFAGDVIKTLARSGKFVNVFDPQNVTELITDEALRKLRVAEGEFRRENEAGPNINVNKSYLRKEKIRRKQTGFVRPEDLARMRQASERQVDEELEDDAEDNFQPFMRQVSVQHPRSLTRIKKGSLVPAPGPVGEVVKRSDYLLDEIEEEIEEGQKPEESKFESLRRAHFVRKDVMITIDDEGDKDKKRDSSYDEDVYSSPDVLRRGYVDQHRPSGLTRLFDEVTYEDQEQGPTLKNYVPLSDKQRNSSLCLITFSTNKKRSGLRASTRMSRELYLKRRHSVDMPDVQPIDDVLLLQHGQTVSRKMSTDYVRTIDRIEQKEETSIRSLEYAKFRPGISVADYQKKNKEYCKNLLRKKSSKEYLKKKNKQ